MVLFKASGKTYSRVIAQQRHAFPFGPAEVRKDEFVLLSKNREDCASTEAQIQYVAKMGEVREATADELERFFPHVAAANRWGVLVRLYWSRRLDRPFNLPK